MSNVRKAALGALIFPIVPIVFLGFDMLTPSLLWQSYVTGATLAVALFGK